jgi:hypothetical protein
MNKKSIFINEVNEKHENKSIFINEVNENIKQVNILKLALKFMYEQIVLIMKYQMNQNQQQENAEVSAIIKRY